MSAKAKWLMLTLLQDSQKNTKTVIRKKQQRARSQSHALCYCISNSYASITSTIRSKISFTDPVACIALYLPS